MKFSSSLCSAALLTLGLLLAPVVASAAAPALPVSTTVEKSTAAGVPPFVLVVKNDSHAALSVSAKVMLSVTAHNADKARTVPAQTVEAGKTFSVAELAALDKVVLSADGFAPLEVTIPGTK